MSEDKKAILARKLKEMGDIGLSKHESPFFDPPSGTSQPQASAAVEDCPHPPIEQKSTNVESDYNKRSRRREKSPITFEIYAERYMTAHHSGIRKSGFTLNADLLEVLKDIIRDVRVKTTLTAYIENIIYEHLKEHRKMLNQTISEKRNNPTINI